MGVLDPSFFGPAVSPSAAGWLYATYCEGESGRVPGRATVWDRVTGMAEIGLRTGGTGRTGWTGGTGWTGRTG